jgi:hypothetical protein
MKESHKQPLQVRLAGAVTLLAIAMFGFRAFGLGLWESVGLGIMLGSALIAASQSQISLRSMFVATFWVAGCFACYAIRRQQPFQRPWSFWIPENVLMLVMMVTPFIAAASFFGRTLLGVVIGVFAVAVFWVIFALT